jgi:hypothetical protein
MEILKNYKAVIATVFIVLVLVVIRSMGVNRFKNDAIRWAEPSFTQANIVTSEQVRSLKGKNLTINLDTKMIPGGEITGDLKNISADSIINRDIAKSILRHKGPVLIYSSQPGLSARIWMILSQMGCKNIYILTDKADNEIFKYKFRPDTLISGPEF